MSVGQSGKIPWWGAREYARSLTVERDKLGHELAEERARTAKLAEIAQNLLKDAKEVQLENGQLKSQMEDLRLLSVVELEAKRRQLEREVVQLENRIDAEKTSIDAERADLRRQVDVARQTIVETRESALLQEVGIYEYNHPLKDVVAYEDALKRLETAIKAAVKSSGGAVHSDAAWEVNGSKAEGLKMTKEISKLMLRAFNAEAESIIRSLKPYKQDAAIQRLRKVEETIRELGKTMQIAVSPAYVQLRIDEIKLTADYLQRQSEEKEMERQEREKMREERKAQQEIERERAKLFKEKQHYENALQTLIENGDESGAGRVREQLSEVAKEIESVDFRAANTRAGYVYVISNIGSFGEKMIKVGMTRRLDPMDRIRELSDASVPFNFDVHALFFAKDAVGIRSVLSGDNRAIATALLTGRRDAISTPVNDAMFISGLGHVLSISGYHMAVVAGVVFFAVRALLALFPGLTVTFPIKKWSAAAAFVAAAFYLLLSGAEVATQRSFFMTAVVLIAVMVDRRAITFRTLAVAAMIVLLIAPEALVHPSFQMSFAATLGLVALVQLGMPNLFASPDNTQVARAALWGGREITMLALASLVAGFATMPYAAFHFHRVTPYGVLANLAAMPVVSVLVMPAGLLGLLAMPFGFDGVFWRLMDVGIGWMIAVSQWVAALPGAIGRMAAFGTGPLAAMSAGIIALGLLRTPLRWTGAGVIALATLWALTTPDAWCRRRAVPPSLSR